MIPSRVLLENCELDNRLEHAKSAVKQWPQNYLKIKWKNGLTCNRVKSAPISTFRRKSGVSFLYRIFFPQKDNQRVTF